MSGTTEEPAADAKRRFVAVDGALQPAGVLSDLSRIIAEYARPQPKWDATQPHMKSGDLALDVDGLAVRSVSDRLDERWVMTDVPLRHFPRLAPDSGSLDGKTRAALRVWSIRIDCALNALYMGVAVPSADQMEVPGAWSLGTHSPCRWHDRAGTDIGLPNTGLRMNAAGSLYRYHFTADLARGEVRVRPFGGSRLTTGLLNRCKRNGRVADLAKFRPFVCMRPGDGATLLHAGQLHARSVDQE